MFLKVSLDGGNDLSLNLRAIYPSVRVVDHPQRVVDVVCVSNGNVECHKVFALDRGRGSSGKRDCDDLVFELRRYDPVLNQAVRSAAPSTSTPQRSAAA